MFYLVELLIYCLVIVQSNLTIDAPFPFRRCWFEKCFLQKLLEFMYYSSLKNVVIISNLSGRRENHYIRWFLFHHYSVFTFGTVLEIGKTIETRAHGMFKTSLSSWHVYILEGRYKEIIRIYSMSDGDECYGGKIKAEKGTRGYRWLGAIFKSHEGNSYLISNGEQHYNMYIFRRWL